MMHLCPICNNYHNKYEGCTKYDNGTNLPNTSYSYTPTPSDTIIIDLLKQILKTLEDIKTRIKF